MRKTRIFIFLSALAIFATGVNEIAIAGKSGKTVQVGTSPDQWFAGDAKCEDPREYHIHAYNDDFITLRHQVVLIKKRSSCFLSSVAKGQSGSILEHLKHPTSPR